MSQLVDLETAKEFMKETLNKVDKPSLISIAEDLEEKSNLFKSYLSIDKLPALSDKEMVELMRNVFVTKRRYKEILEKISVDDLKSKMHSLLFDQDEITIRFQNFLDDLGDVDTSIKYDFASELLHYSQPEKYWLWNRWVWDPERKTGALPLVVSEEFDLKGENYGEVYVKVGKGVAFVNSVAEAADFQFINRSLFGTDVFLSCVYTVYAYTVLRMRMTQEFNKVMPGLTEFSRRLLGVHKLPQAA